MIFVIKYWLARVVLYLFVLPKHELGAEVGVWEGKNAKLLYRLTRPARLYLIDPYNESLRSEYEKEAAFNGVCRWAKDRWATVVRETSKQASTHIHRLDWIYIDGDHFDLYNDLLYWFHNVEPGGMIMGDDYGHAYPQVKIDIERFCSENKIRLHTLHYQWWFKK